MDKTYKALLTGVGLFPCAILFTIWGGISSAADQAPPRYKLVCRGGGGMVAQYKAAGGEHIFHVPFRKAGRGSGEGPPGPGECAWVDRPLTEGEPRSLVYKTTSEGYIYLEIHEGRITVGDASPQPVRNIIDAISRGQVFHVMCYNDGNSLQITGEVPRK